MKNKEDKPAPEAVRDVVILLREEFLNDEITSFAEVTSLGPEGPSFGS